jgi:alkylhydroperoxidase family enzyme
VCSAGGTAEAKILALDHHADSNLFDEREKSALRYADAITRSDEDVDDALFAALRQHFEVDEVVELTAIVAWENASSKFNHALRIGSQGLWRREPEDTN